MGAKTMSKTTKALALATLFALSTLPAQASESQAVVNVNTASMEQLQLLYRTGPVVAGRIVEARPLAGLEALDAVKGVGLVWLSVNSPYVTFEGATTLGAKVTKPEGAEL